MRYVKVAFPVVAVVLLFSVSATGQQSDPSPSPYPAKSIDLPNEPEIAPVELTLAEAARANNFPVFEELFLKGGDGNAGFAELYGFWKWSLTDPIGGFYSDEMHAKFATEYPDYAAYIADFDIVDSNGHTFYPSAETRAFLLKHAIEGTAVVAKTAVPKAVKEPVVHIAAAKPVPNAVEKPAAVVTKAPAVASRAAVKPASVDARDARRSIARVVTSQAAAKTVATAIPKPVPVATNAPVATPRAIPLPVSDHRVARGFALIVAGLIAIGVLMLILRTPREEEPAEPSREAPVEPLRIIPLEPTETKKTA